MSAPINLTLNPRSIISFSIIIFTSHPCIPNPSSLPTSLLETLPFIYCFLNHFLTDFLLPLLISSAHPSIYQIHLLFFAYLLLSLSS